MTRVKKSLLGILLLVAVAAMLCSFAGPAFGASITCYWTGGGGSGSPDWLDTSNWVSGVAPGGGYPGDGTANWYDRPVFGSDATGNLNTVFTPSASTAFYVDKLTITNPSGAVTIGCTTGNGGLEIGGGGIDMSAATQDLTLTAQARTGGGTWNVADGRTLGLGSVLSAGALTLSGGSVLMDINTEGASSQFSGSGTVTFSDTMKFDVAGVSGTTGTWNLVANGTYGAAFAVKMANGSAFTESGNVWTYVDGTKQWSFTESTGSLTLDVVPEPSMIVLLGAGLIGLLAYAWRQRK